MKTNLIVIIIIALLLFFFGFWTSQLKSDISALKSQHAVELITEIDCVKSAEFAIYEAERKKQDSIYKSKIDSLSNENQNLKTRYNCLYRDYSTIFIERPRL